jgi:hypothetical protein
MEDRVVEVRGMSEELRGNSRASSTFNLDQPRMTKSSINPFQAHMVSIFSSAKVYCIERQP